ncbi:MAG: hypothetical protein ABJI60_15040 [Kangiellaceae bacterium]
MMKEWQNDESVLEEIFPSTKYLDRNLSNSRKKKYQWRDVEIAKEKLKLKNELLALRNYH